MLNVSCTYSIETISENQNIQAESPALRQLLNQQRVQSYIDNLIKNAKISDQTKTKAKSK